MFRYLKTKLSWLAIVAVVLASFSSGELSAAPRKSYKAKTYSTRTRKSYKAKTYSTRRRKPYKTKTYSTRRSSKKSYTKKAPLAGYGKPSRVNRLPKTKIISGHPKRSSKGYTYVNPYARSK